MPKSFLLILSLFVLQISAFNKFETEFLGLLSMLQKLDLILESQLKCRVMKIPDDDTISSYMMLGKQLDLFSDNHRQTPEEKRLKVGNAVLTAWTEYTVFVEIDPLHITSLIAECGEDMRRCPGLIFRRLNYLNLTLPSFYLLMLSEFHFVPHIIGASKTRMYYRIGKKIMENLDASLKEIPENCVRRTIIDYINRRLKLPMAQEGHLLNKAMA